MEYYANGIIKSPGKFEGEPAFVPFYWEEGLAGGADRDEGNTYPEYVFILSEMDKERDPRISMPDNATELILWEDDNGFVNHHFKYEEEVIIDPEECAVCGLIECEHEDEPGFAR